MDWQNLINLGLGTLLAAVGWFARAVWDEVQDLKREHSNLRVELPTIYVTKQDHESSLQRIEKRMDSGVNELKTMLTRIDDKLSKKADK